MDTPPDSQRKAWARLSTLTSFVSRICFFKARCSDSDSVNGFIVIPPAFDFTRVRLGGVKKILSTYLVHAVARAVVNPEFPDTTTNRMGIAEIAETYAGQAGTNAGTGLDIA